MSRMISVFGPVVVLALGYFYLKSTDGDLNLGDLFKPRGEQAESAGNWGGAAPRSAGQTITIASFNIQVFGEKKMSDPNVVAVLADIVRRFDVVAIQEIRAISQEIMPRFLEHVNANGARYDYVIGPRLGRTSSKEQYAYVYNTRTIEIDPTSVYTVHDPDDLLHREPFVAAFRARGPPPDEAFTFTLVNVHVVPDPASERRFELDVLADVFQVVRGDGRNEDDVMILGDFNSDDLDMGRLGNLPYMMCVVSGIMTNTIQTNLYDNVVLDRRATLEFTGNWGVLDIMRLYNLTTEQALKVSDHLPVWAEFSVYEGGRGGPLASRPETVR